MAGMPAVAVVTRRTVVAASLLVIVVMGGRALLLDSSPVSASSPLPAAGSGAPRTAPVAAASSPSDDGLAPPSAALSPASVTPTALTLQRVTPPGKAPRRGHVTLRGELTDPSTQGPVQGSLTLWRRTAHGRWRVILADRGTSPGGVVLFDVVQSAGRSVYRLTFAPDGVHAAATSAPLTVRR